MLATPLRFSPALACTYTFRVQQRRRDMNWKTPQVIEIAVGMEINCYACAEI